ncbi:MAG: cytochrome o ubiquinol oxidase subunit IV [Rhabdochlamydiaceae bacterium]|jgi:cytochrome o ubiquinol oxidase operon protein cyoD
MIDLQYKWNKSSKPLVIGFVLSLILTLLAYLITKNHLSSGLPLVYLILGLATLQALLQCIFFLHINAESHPRWSLISLIFTAIVLVIIVGGSLWIMYSLDYNMMPNM